ncbi:uncharacterized protein Dmoj_GI22197 [Drosophila mojavensis]|uniref:Uncharacterized protein n=1 Tax=Drosophila mojavensis TaxID=7230 RepID=B4K8B9_DROMO|nr:uncharacterized protein Dmoj_GI22197 [Drosophila mojavensis]
MRAPIIVFLALLLGNCLDLGNGLLFKKLKALKGLKSGYSSGNGGYGYNSNVGYGGYGGYGYGAGYSSGYGSGYGGGQSYRPKNRQRTGRTYSQIARVLRPDPYLGLGAGRYLPRAPYSHLWG